MIDIKAILEKHSLWLKNKEGGERANLQGANLQAADLRGDNLQEANLYGANLFGADLSGADLSEANLQGADLSEASLYRANLQGADLTNTVLDPNNTPNGDYNGFEEDGDYIIGYRTMSQFLRNKEYVVGDKVVAPYFSTCVTSCHPGLYLYPTIAMVVSFQFAYSIRGPIIRVRTKKTDIHRASSKWRCKEFEVLEQL